MKLLSHDESTLLGAVHINDILKAGIFALDTAIRERQEVIGYDCNLFSGVNPDHTVFFSDDQVMLYDFKKYQAIEVGLSLFASLGVEFSILVNEANSDSQWDKLKNIVARLMNKPIYFNFKN